MTKVSRDGQRLVWRPCRFRLSTGPLQVRHARSQPGIRDRRSSELFRHARTCRFVVTRRSRGTSNLIHSNVFSSGCALLGALPALPHDLKDILVSHASLFLAFFLSRQLLNKATRKETAEDGTADKETDTE